MGQNITDKVKFDFIRYANCWEDAEILLEAFGDLSGKKVLSIASAGDNSFSLLYNNTDEVLAVDVNEIQLHLCELKKAAIIQMNHEEYISFIGFIASSNRKEKLTGLKSLLPSKTYDYWQTNIEQIEQGIVYQGKFEKYLSSFATKILPLIHSKKRRDELIAPKSIEEQAAFYHNKWNTWRYRLLFKIFFSKMIMGKYGRDPEFLKEVKLEVSEYIFQKAEKHLLSKYVQGNLFVYYLMNGKFGDILPHYARKENYETIKSRISRIHFKAGYLQHFASKEYTHYNLSNIFEYMPREVFEEVCTEMLEAGNEGTKYAYWNLMVPRRISGSFRYKVQYEKENSQQMSEKDKCFFYNQFILDTKL